MTREEAIICLQGLLDNPLINKGSYLAQAIEMAIKALEQEPCEDTVSRKEIIEHYTTGEMANVKHIDKNHLLAFVEQLPSVRPQEQIGTWKEIVKEHKCYARDDTYTTTEYHCSECGAEPFVNEDGFYELSNYCPNCGARMDKPKTRGWKADTIILDEDVFMSIPYERQESSGEK